jgi:TolA-binding protein
MRLSCVLLFIAGGAVVWWICLASPPRRESPPRAASVAPDPRIEEIAARLDRIESRLEGADRPVEGLDRLDRITERLDQLDAELAGRPVTPIRESPAAVPVETLRLRAKEISMEATRRAAAVEAWGAVAEATGDPEQKAEALAEQGDAYRKLGDWSRAAASFRKVVELAGLHSERGRSAAYQLGWCEQFGGDSTAAYRTFRELLDTPGLPKSMEAAARLQVAAVADAMGDSATARREYETLVSEYANDRHEHYRKIAKAATDRLGELR